MTAPTRLAGIRLAGAGAPAPLLFAELAEDDIQAGDWLFVQADGEADLGRVIVSSTQIVEVADSERRLATVRRARAEERPGRRSGAGAALLESLGLPGSATGSAEGGGAVPASEQ